MAHEFQATFAALRKVMAEESAGMDVTADGPAGFMVNGGWSATWKRALFFGGVRLGKAYVSYHLFPLYMHSPLHRAVTPELRKRMQGKSCFNFRSVTPEQLADLRALTRACAGSMRSGALEKAIGTCERQPAARKSASRKAAKRPARKPAKKKA